MSALASLRPTTHVAPVIDTAYGADSTAAPTVTWRIDIPITSLNQSGAVAVPIVVLELVFPGTGEIRTYRLRAEELHQWRFSLAKGMRDAVYLQAKEPPRRK